MSTFCGYFEDLKNVSVDRFDGSNLNSKIYFLSHCHTDHMIGLDSKAFQGRLLNNTDIYLYASPVSIIILSGLYPDIAHKFKILPLKDSVLIEIPQHDDRFVTVTAIPAGHCPGSVMILFESNKNILYTGDIRLNANDLDKYKTVLYNSGCKKHIDLMYLDTTFFSPIYSKFPSRNDSLTTLLLLINDWICESPNHVINLITSARYGHEFLFKELNKNLKMPIHVNDAIYDVYKYIPDMDKIITRNGDLTKIHASCMGYKKICLDKSNYHVRTIKTCAWSFRNFKDNLKVYTHCPYSELYRVCYSCHSSYEELVDFVNFFKPLQLKPSVVPNNLKEKEELYSNIDNIICKYNIPSIDLNKECKDIDSQRKEENLFAISDGSRNSAKVIKNDDLLDSPPRDLKRTRLL